MDTRTPSNTFYRDSIRNTFTLDALRTHLSALDLAAPVGSDRASNDNVGAYRRCIDESIANHAVIAASVETPSAVPVFWLRLANRDEAQPWQSKPGAPPHAIWVPVLSTEEASRVVRGYVAAYDLAHPVAWAGGEIVEDGEYAADMNYLGELSGMNTKSQAFADFQQKKEAARFAP